MQPWRRWREPLAVVLLVALGLMLVVRVAALWTAIDVGGAGRVLGSLPGGDELLVLAAAGAVLWCATPSPPAAGPGADPRPSEDSAAPSRTSPAPASLSPHAFPIAVAGLVVIGLTVFCWLTLSVLDVIALLRWPTPETRFVLIVAEGVFRLVMPLVSFAAVVVATARAAAVRRAAAVSDHAAPAAADAAPADSSDISAVTAAPERLPAAWQADEATGAVWLTADDAAEGRPGLSWSDPSARGSATAQGWAAGPSGPVEGPFREPPGGAVMPPAADQDDDLR